MFRAILAAAALSVEVLASAGPPHAFPEGLWSNPHDSVVVQTGECGGKLCGWVIWASERAKADASEKGTRNLVGTELLQNYRPDGPDRWSGTVYVPDTGGRFASEITQLSPTRLQIRGCILHRLLCKSQIWTHVDRAHA
jgi:uncharacterized protein (DUF2147 family)